MPIQVRFTDATLDVRMLWILELAMRDWMNIALAVSNKNVGNELRFQSMWGKYEFSPGFTAEGATNRSLAAKLGY